MIYLRKLENQKKLRTTCSNSLKFSLLTLLIFINIAATTKQNLIGLINKTNITTKYNVRVDDILNNVNHYINKNDNINLLMMASCEGNYKLVKALLEANANPFLFSNIKLDKYPYYYRALEFAKEKNFTEIEKILMRYMLKHELQRYKYILSQLKEFNISLENLLDDINQYIDPLNGLTVLMLAADKGYVNLIKWLLECGADPYLKTKHNSSTFAKNWRACDFSKHKTPTREYKEATKLLDFCDLTLVGISKFNDGLGRISIGIIDILKDNISINFIKTRQLSYYEPELNQNIRNILKNENNNIGKVLIFTDVIEQTKRMLNYTDSLDNNKFIKLAYSMFETSAIPKKWVDIINANFDAVIVPDEFINESYKNSGVQIPIFVLPLGLYLNEFLEKPIKKHANNPFVFGCMSSFDPRKNHKKLIKAFAKEFGNNPNVLLKINGRAFDEQVLQDLIKKLNLKNIQLTKENLTWSKYIEYMESIDCYVNIPKGEGFSITPREALALGIPCILTDNTAQKTICSSGVVRSIDSNKTEKADYKGLYLQSLDFGYFFNCTEGDVQKALRDVYDNYELYLKKAKHGRNWARQYNWHNLKHKYLNLVKPKKIIFGKENRVTDGYLETNSELLYQKYLKVLNY